MPWGHPLTASTTARACSGAICCQAWMSESTIATQTASRAITCWRAILPPSAPTASTTSRCSQRRSATTFELSGHALCEIIVDAISQRDIGCGECLAAANQEAAPYSGGATGINIGLAITDEK